jgi:hypothetical protein
MGMLLHKAFVILIGENTLTVLDAGRHQVAALNIAVAHYNQYFEQSLIEETSDLEYLLHERVD